MQPIRKQVLIIRYNSNGYIKTVSFKYKIEPRIKSTNQKELSYRHDHLHTLINEKDCRKSEVEITGQFGWQSKLLSTTCDKD